MMDYRTLPHHQILCLDMKSFFASCECVRRGWDPEKTYLAVVGDLERSGSIVLATTPRLKQDYGISTGKRLFDVPRLPSIHIVSPNMRHYLHQSLEITRLLHRFVPKEAIHPYSIDEWWICVDGTEKIFGDAWSVGQKIRAAIYEQFGLPSCIGIGPNKFLAKVILDIEGKRTGLASCSYEEVAEKLWPQPVQKIWGIGPRLARHLQRMGIRTLGHLAHTPREILEKKFGVIGNQLYYHAWGVDLAPVTGAGMREVPKSFGHGITLLKDYRDPNEIRTIILELSEEVARRARAANMAGRTIHLGIGYSQTETKSGFHCARTISQPTNVTLDIYHICLELFEQHYTGEIVRRIYLSLGQLSPDEHVQLNLFEDVMKKRTLGYVMDDIRRKHGPTALLRARSYTPGGVILERSKKIGGHWA